MTRKPIPIPAKRAASPAAGNKPKKPSGQNDNLPPGVLEWVLASAGPRDDDAPVRLEIKTPKPNRRVIFLDPVTLKQVRQPIVVMETFDREDYAAQWQADFGQKLAAARVKEGISQSELARRSGLQQSHISKLEAGRMEPRVTTIFTLADTIGIRAGALFPVDRR